MRPKAIILIVCAIALFSFAGSGRADWPTASDFVYPVGGSDHAGWKKQLNFNELDGTKGYHVGEDWVRTSGVTDGESVHAVANGLVVYAAKPSTCWGGVVMILHTAPPGTNFTLPAGGTAPCVVSMYAHLATYPVTVNSVVQRGQVIGTIAASTTCNPSPMLHFEIRRYIYRSIAKLPAGPHYLATALNANSAYVDPSLFIDSNSNKYSLTENFINFNPDQYYIAGDAYRDAAKLNFVLTDETSPDQSGRIFWKQKVNLTTWSMEFDFRITDGSGFNSGADGFTFAFVKDYGYPINSGSTLDFSGADGYAIEFDTFPNSYDPYKNLANPNDNHVALVKNSTSTQHLAYQHLYKVSDDTVRHVVINFDAGHIVVTVAGVKKLDYVIPGYEPFDGYIGFTAGTGEDFNTHVIDNIVFKTY
jgi:murein DD-endopeptidase MepM/ murein hydrolase activator NlpD